MRRNGDPAPTVDLDLRRGINRLPLGIQAVLGAAGLFVLLTASLGAAILVVTHFNRDVIALNTRNSAYERAVTATALAANTIGNDERAFLQSGSATLATSTDQQISFARQLFDTAASTATNAAERGAVSDAQARFEQWVIGVRHEFATFQGGHRQQAVAEADGSTRALRETYDESTIRAQNLNTAAAESADVKIAGESSRSVTILVAALVVLSAIGIMIAFWLVRSIIRPVYKILSFLVPHGSADPEL